MKRFICDHGSRHQWRKLGSYGSSARHIVQLNYLFFPKVTLYIMANNSRQIYVRFGSTQLDRDSYRGLPGDSSRAHDAAGEYGSSVAGLSQGHLSLPIDFSSFYENPIGAPGGTANKKPELYQMRSSSPISLNPTPYDIYCTQVRNTMDEAMLEWTFMLLDDSRSAESSVSQSLWPSWTAA